MTSYFFDDPDRSSLPVATADLIRRLHNLDAGMRESGTQQRIEVDKQPALLTQFTSKSPLGGMETDLVLTVARPEGLFYLMFASPDRELGDTRPIFDHMVQSIRFDESKP